MSAHPNTIPSALPRHVHAGLNLLVIDIVGRAWLRLWLTLYPAGAAAVRWTLHDELDDAPTSQRWRRAIAFFANLPRLAASQSAAESDPATETGGEPPEPPRLSEASGWTPGAIVRGLGMGVAIAFAVITALVMWINGLSTLGDLIDADVATGTATGAIAVSLLYAVIPLAIIMNRRRFSWTPSQRAGRDESPSVRVGWWIATAAFGLLALVLFITVFGHFIDAYDWELAKDLNFGAALGSAAVALIAIGPLAWVVRRRYWIGSDPIQA